MEWQQLRQYVDKKQFLKFIELDYRYDIWWVMEGNKLDCEIEKGDPPSEDQADFETNYKPFCNKTNASDIDALGRWIVRSESRREDWDTVFQGAGDSLQDMKAGEGTPFLFDFSAPQLDPRWVTEGVPTGYRQQSIKWNFMDPVYVKEGTIYYFDIPKGSYMDFYVAVTQGYPYDIKIPSANYDITRKIKICTVPYLRFARWVNHYHVEGNAPMGDELNTESAAEVPAYPFHIFETIITVPEVMGWQAAHGHWALELYKPRTMYFVDE